MYNHILFNEKPKLNIEYHENQDDVISVTFSLNHYGNEILLFFLEGMTNYVDRKSAIKRSKFIDEFKSNPDNFFGVDTEQTIYCLKYYSIIYCEVFKIVDNTKETDMLYLSKPFQLFKQYNDHNFLHILFMRQIYYRSLISILSKSLHNDIYLINRDILYNTLKNFSNTITPKPAKLTKGKFKYILDDLAALNLIILQKDDIEIIENQPSLSAIHYSLIYQSIEDKSNLYSWNKLSTELSMANFWLIKKETLRKLLNQLNDKKILNHQDTYNIDQYIIIQDQYSHL